MWFAEMYIGNINSDVGLVTESREQQKYVCVLVDDWNRFFLSVQNNRVWHSDRNYTDRILSESNNVSLCVCVCVFVSSESVGVSQAEALKEENDSLRCQLDAYRNEVDLLKQEQGKNQPISCEEDGTHSQQLSFLQQALQGMQKVMKHLMMLCVE